MNNVSTHLADFTEGVNKNHIPKYDNLLEKGKFKFIVDWLRENIHSKGRLMLTKEIVKKATKEDVKLEFFKSYLKTKYLN